MIPGFSEERLQRTKEFLTELWHLEPLERPGYMLSGFPNKEPEPTDIEKPEPLSLGANFKNWGNMLKGQIWNNRLHAEFNDDFVPCLFPYLGTGVLASAFGCEIIFPENEQPWTAPIVKEPEDVYRLPEPEVDSGLLKDVLELTKFMNEKTNEQYPIRVTDIQGPLDTASLIWKYDDFLSAMYSSPEAVHCLLDMVTDLIIEFVRAQRELVKEWVPNHCPQVWVPEDWGISISEDVAAVISPEHYAEFAIPYNSRLSEAFNGLHIHSCGDFSWNFDNMSKIPKLRGVDFGTTESPYLSAIEKLSGKTLLIPRLGLNKFIHFSSCLEYLKFVWENKREDTNLFIFIERGAKGHTGEFTENSIEEIEAFLKEQNIWKE